MIRSLFAAVTTLYGVVTATVTDAAIVYHRPAQPVIGAYFGGGLNIHGLDVDLDGTEDFHFASGAFVTGMVTLGTNRVSSLLYPDVGGYISPVGLGELIGSSGTFQNAEWHHSSENLHGTPYPIGLTIGACADMSGCGGVMQYTNGFIAVEFQRSTGVHYGWLHFIGNSAEDPMSGGSGGRVTEWAWESEPGVSIISGAVPEASAATFLAGAAAFLTHRRRYWNSRSRRRRSGTS